MVTLKDIGREIRARRKELRMELFDVHDYSEVPISTLSNLENGRGNPTYKTIQKVLDVLGLEIKIQAKSK